MLKAINMWAVTSRVFGLHAIVGYTKKDTIKAWEKHTGEDWSIWRKRGYSVIKVVVKPAPAGGEARQ
jgi:hypothetical protein